MKEKITYEEWYKRIFDDKRYIITRVDYGNGTTYFLDEDDDQYKSAKYNNEMRQIEIQKDR